MMILRGILVILILLWIAGFALHIAGAAIHLLLVVALALFIYSLIAGNRSAT
jgi:hypothetical protein